MSRQLKSSLLILLAAFIWGTAFLAQKDGGQVGTFTFNGVRSFIGGVSLLPVIFVFDRLRKNAPSDARSEMGWNKKVITGGVLCGIVLFAASSLQQYGVMYTSLGKAGFITALYSLIVPVFSIFLGKKVGKLTWIAVAIGLVGLYLLSMRGESFRLSYGDSFVLACAFGFAIQIMLVDHFAPEVDGVKLSAIEFFTTGVISLFFMFALEEPSLKALYSVLPSLLYAGVLSSGVAYTLQVIGQKYAEPTQAALIMCMESVFSMLTGAIVLHERLLAIEYLGAALIFTAVVLSQLPDRSVNTVKEDI